MASPPMLNLTFTSVTWTNMPAAHTFIFGAGYARWEVDARDYTEVKLSTTVGLVGASTATLYARFRTTDDLTTVAANWTLPLTASGQELAVSLTAVATDDTGWQQLAPAARTLIYVGLFGAGGDGALDPIFGGPYLSFR